MASPLFSTSPTSVLHPELTASSQRRQSSKSLSLEDFLARLPDAIDQEESVRRNETSTKQNVENPDNGSTEEGPIAKLMKKVILDPEDIELYAHFDSSKHYTRNLVATDDKSYTLLLLCWNPGQSSMIHNHPCDGCWMRVLKGSVQECRYSQMVGQDDTLECISDQSYTEGQFAYITDSMGYHKVGNPSSTVPSMTLHLYCPPFDKCQIWRDPQHASQTSQSCVVYHSEYGVIVE